MPIARFDAQTVHDAEGGASIEITCFFDDDEAPQTLRIPVEATLPGASATYDDDAGPIVAAVAPADGPLIGRGGMGEVHRVRDAALDRTVARKTLLPSHAGRPRAVQRFVHEARLTARLQHPGVVPVHASGTLPDGRPWFTMREVQGRTLEAVISEVHAASAGTWRAGPSGWTFRRLVEAFRTVCETVAYAHAEGVVHRDLKPENVMVGAFGEVLVLDWGLAGPESQEGRVAGTPAYMAPEQARGEADRIGPASDVYALGGVLYTILAGRTPHEGPAADVIASVAKGPPPGPTRPGIALPVPLLDVCARAMAAQPEDRPTALDLARELSAWLDGVRRRDEAVAVVESALDRAPEPARLRGTAAGLRARAHAALEDLDPWSPEADKAVAWAWLDEAAALERTANVAELEIAWKLAAALAVADDLPEARAALARHHRDALADAERRGDADAAAREEALLRLQIERLPAGSERDGLAAWLDGDSHLDVTTDPPGATVILERWEERRRRLVAEDARTLGPAPATAEVPRGRYRLRLEAPGRAPVALPFRLRRGDAWKPAPIHLPPAEQLGPDDVYVPAGAFDCGGDPLAVYALPARRILVGGFVIRRYPVTNAEYLAFLRSLASAGEDLAPWGPRPTGERDSAWLIGAPHLPEGLLADAPVVFVTWGMARRYAAWLGARDGLPWRLPSEIEWEKAARGDDGRAWPWGDHADPCRAVVAGSRADAAGPAPVGSFPDDESPYGVRDMGGNVREWCLESWQSEGVPVDEGRPMRIPDPSPGDRHVRRGGCWTSGLERARVCSRGKGHPDARREHLGFRLARSL